MYTQEIEDLIGEYCAGCVAVETCEGCVECELARFIDWLKEESKQ